MTNSVTEHDLTRDFASFGAAMAAYNRFSGDRTFDDDCVAAFTGSLRLRTAHLNTDWMGVGAYFPDDRWAVEFLKEHNFVHQGIGVGQWYATDAGNRPIARMKINSDSSSGVQYQIYGAEYLVLKFADLCLANVETSYIGLGVSTFADEPKPKHPAITIKGFVNTPFGVRANIESTPITTIRKQHPSYYPYITGGIVALVREFMASDDSVLIIAGPPGTGKTSAASGAVVELGLFPVYATNSEAIAHTNFVEEVFKAHDTFAAGDAPSDEMSPARKGLMVNCTLGEDSTETIKAKFRAVKCQVPDGTVLERSKMQPVAIIEDADALLAPRSAGNKQMSDLLNYTDGATGNGCRKVIFTTNLLSPSQIEPALLRAGRCFGMFDFRKLTASEAIAARAAAGLAPFTGQVPDLLSLAEALTPVRSSDSPKSMISTLSMPVFSSITQLN